MFKVLSALFLFISAIAVLDLQDEQKTIVIFGDSITAGYGISLNAFPALIQNRIDSIGKPYQVMNAGLSGETTAGGLQRIDWILRSKPDIFILELGGNDGLRGLSLEQTRLNLTRMINKIKSANSKTKILLAGMQIPPNLGQSYTNDFKKLYAEVAEKNKVELIPFLLVNVGGEKDLNLADGIHPNESGHKILAETVWEYISPHLN